VLLNSTYRITRLSFFLAVSVVLSIIELPFTRLSPLTPWAKIGLANIPVIVVVFTMDMKAVLFIAIWRTIICSLLFGTFMSYVFFLSFMGSLISALMMEFGFRIVRLNIYSISVLGALTHNLTQLIVAYILIVSHKGILFNLPFMVVVSLLAGAFNGVIAKAIIRSLDEKRRDSCKPI